MNSRDSDSDDEEAVADRLAREPGLHDAAAAAYDAVLSRILVEVVETLGRAVGVGEVLASVEVVSNAIANASERFDVTGMQDPVDTELRSLREHHRMLMQSAVLMWEGFSLIDRESLYALRSRHLAERARELVASIHPDASVAAALPDQVAAVRRDLARQILATARRDVSTDVADDKEEVA